MDRSLTQWVAYIQTLHVRTIDLGLDRVNTVWQRFKPKHMPVVITVAGTNGKGSSVSMLESVYRHAGYKTAAFTSPHLVDFNERFCLQNKPISDDKLCAAFKEIESIRENVSLTFFEFNTLLALYLFCQEDVDVMLLEVGLGGRLDAVNIVQNDLALITSIALDHCAWLGNTREKIGAEKAGIIKLKGKAVIADQLAPKSIIHQALKQQANVVYANKNYQIITSSKGKTHFSSKHMVLKIFDGVKIAATLKHAQANQAGVIAAIAMCHSLLPIIPAQLAKGLAQQQLAGRLQWIESTPPMLLDVSHNDASMMAMLDYIDKLQLQGDIHAVFGTLEDKQYKRAYEKLLARIDRWYLSSIHAERGQSSVALAAKLFSSNFSNNSQVRLFDTPELAFLAAHGKAKSSDLIIIFGSFHLVGDIMRELKNYTPHFV